MSRITIIAFWVLAYINAQAGLITYRHSTHASVNLKLPKSMAFEAVELIFWQHAVAASQVSSLVPARKMSGLTDKNGRYRFSIEKITKPGYITIYRKAAGFEGAYIQYYLVEPGDSVDVRIDSIQVSDEQDMGLKVLGEYTYIDVNYKYFIKFSGRGAGKYTCRYLADRKHGWDPKYSFPLSSDRERYNMDEFNYVTLKESLALLQSMRGEMSSVAYDVLQADFIAVSYSRIMAALKLVLERRTWVERNCIVNGFPQEIRHVILDSDYIPRYSRMARDISCRLPMLVYRKAILLSVFSEHWDNEPQSDRYRQELTRIKKLCQGELMLKSVVLCFKLGSNHINLVRDLITKDDVSGDAGYWGGQLKGLLEASDVGRLAYDFALPDVRGDVIHLHDFRGKFVFIDFWFTGCEGCRMFYDETLKEVEEYYRDSSDVVFLSVCIDIDRDRWVKSVQSELYTSRSAINLYTNGHGEDDSLVRFYSVHAYPYQVLLDRSGRISMIGGLRVPADSLKGILSKHLQ